MKRLKYILPVMFALMLGFSLFGCQQEAPADNSASDTDLLKEMGAADADQEEEVISPYYVLVVGNDTRIGTVEINKEEYADGTGRSDTMMLARIDPLTYQITLVTVPRDTSATLNGTTVKINEIYRQQGIDAAVSEVEALTGVSIEYYLNMDFVQFENFINGINHITADVPINMQLQDIVGGETISLSPGTQELDGAQALVLARSRKQYANDLDASRQIQDRQIVASGIMKIAADPTLASVGVQALLANTQTNWAAEDITAEVTNFASHADQIQIISGTGPYKGTEDPNAGNQWLIPRDEETWHQIMKLVDEGGDPNSIVTLPEVRAA